MKPKLIRVGPTARPLFPVTLPQSAPLTAVFSVLLGRFLAELSATVNPVIVYFFSSFIFFNSFSYLFAILEVNFAFFPRFFFFKKRNFQQKKLFLFSFLSDKKKLLQKIVIMPRVVVCYASWL